MRDLYILRRRISDIDWEDCWDDNILMSPDEELLEQIAERLDNNHRDSQHCFNYWVVKAPGLIESMEVFEAHKDKILDSWEDI